MSDSEPEYDLDRPVPKRRKIAPDSSDSNVEVVSRASSRAISPPPMRRSQVNTTSRSGAASCTLRTQQAKPLLLSSPFQLTHVQDYPDSNNIHTTKLTDILRDPMIKEMWQFNFLIDLDFMMAALDGDVRDTVKINVIHGFWKKEDETRQALYESAEKYSNIKLITAFMAEVFGTHHTKMMVLFRHDDTAQIVIHTANMIIRDWRNMSQAVWRSPWLPLLPPLPADTKRELEDGPVGTGRRFKLDFLKYVGSYERSRTGPLTDQLEQYDFSSIRAALIGSIPCKQRNRADATLRTTRSGWLGLQDFMRHIPTSTQSSEKSVIVAQVSSIATLGASPDWIDNFFTTLNASSKAFAKPAIPRVIFPNVDEIRRSLDGYASGGSIHTKIQSKAQQKQVDYLRPRLCYWAGDHDGARPSEQATREAGRRRSAPHIKTYVRFTNSDMKQIDWAMVTSANLSCQAWGTLPNKDGEIRISSYELGVVVWPALFDDEEAGPDPQATEMKGKVVTTSRTIMVPAFKSDIPEVPADIGDATRVLGFRMPYDLPLVRYTKDELPWCATSQYDEPDWRGQTWQGFER